METEYWKPIEGYEGLYEISSLGRVKNLGKHYKISSYGHERIMRSNPRIASLHYDNTGYLTVALTKNGKCKSYSIHRLIAKAFIPNNDPSKTQVNHKNGLKDDNRIENLEWCTPKENTIHAHQHGLCGRNKKAKYVAQLNDKLEIINVYQTATKASIAMGVSPKNSTISLVCRKNYGTAYGYKWKYISLEDYVTCVLELKKGNHNIILDSPFYEGGNIHTTKGIPVAKLNLNGEVICVYSNARQASLYLNENDDGRTIRRVCNGELHKHKGYKWKWISEEEYNSYIAKKV